jgi:sugar phosphate permease
MFSTSKPNYPWRDIPGGVWALGIDSLLMDISSEMIHALLPVYLVSVLGTSMLTVGVIEGIAEATASITKIFSGALSDWLGKRKLLAVLGYSLAAFTKPVFPLAPSVDWLVAARFVDRIGKGIRGAPRDALVADLAPPQVRGASFGLRQSLDTVGAFAGPLLAIGLMWLTSNNFTSVFWLAVIPGFLALALIIFAVHEPKRPEGLRQVRAPLSGSELKRRGGAYWWVVAVATVFTLARFSEAFLILKAQAVGMPIAFVPAVLVVMNAVYALAAYPAGILSDKIDRITLLFIGLALLVAADVALGFAASILSVMLGVMLWGSTYGLDSRTACHAGRRRGAPGVARNGLRHVQPSWRSRVAGGEHHRGRALGCSRPCWDIPCRSRVGRTRAHRSSRCPGTTQ